MDFSAEIEDALRNGYIGINRLQYGDPPEELKAAAEEFVAEVMTYPRDLQLEYVSASRPWA